MSYDFSEQIIVPTEGYVKTMAVVDGEERAVYYVESNTGMLHQANFDDITDVWIQPMNFTVDGEMALTPRSDVLIVADTRGVITAYQVANIPITDAPSNLPSDGPSLAPTMSPIATLAPVVVIPPPTDAPIATDVPVAQPTEAPVVSPEPAPVMAPVAAPTAAPVSSGASRSLFMASTAILVAAMLL